METESGLKHSAYKVVLVALFALGLFLANVISKSRNKVDLSNLVVLPHTGLAVPVPVGGGRQAAEVWQLNEMNAIQIGGGLIFGGQRELGVLWKYHLAARAEDAGAYLEAMAAAIDAEIEAQGVMTGNEMDMHYVRLSKAGDTREYYLGAAALEAGRLLELQVSGPAEMDPEPIFRMMYEEAEFTPNENLKNGSAFVERLKDMEAGPLMAKGLSEGETMSLFLIHNENNKVTGFNRMETAGAAYPEEGLTVRNDYFNQVTRGYNELSREVLNVSPGFETFNWISSRAALGMRTATSSEVVMEADGAMKVKSGAASQTYYPGPASLPDAFLDAAAVMYYTYGGSEMVVDFILSTGMVLPVLISGQETREQDFFGRDVAYEVTFELIPMTGKSLTVYLDSKGTILGKIDQVQPRMSIWKRTTEKQFEQEFGEMESLLNRYNF